MLFFVDDKSSATHRQSSGFGTGAVLLGFISGFAIPWLVTLSKLLHSSETCSSSENWGE